MYTIIILLCVVNFAVTFDLAAKDSSVEVLNGQSTKLTWEITNKASGSTFRQGYIDFVVGTGVGNSVAIFADESAGDMVDPYNGRGWTAAFGNNKDEVVLNIKNAKSEDDGNYSLKLVYKTSSLIVKTVNIRLNVLVTPHYPDDSYYTSGNEESDEGTAFTIKCDPQGSPKPIDIVWEKNNVRFRKTDTNNPNLVFPNLTRSDTGTYVCKASTEKSGSATIQPTTNLVVKYKPVNTKFNTTSVVLNGEKVILQCSAEANPKASFRIFDGGIPEEPNSQSGAVSLNVKLEDDGKVVKCTPFNRLGKGPTAEFKIDVKVKPEILSGLPEEADAIEGRNYSVTCSAKGKPAPEIIWLRDGSPLRKMPPTLIVGKLTDNTYQSESTLTLGPATRNDNARYRCEATNKHGTAFDEVKLDLLFLPTIKRVLVNDRDFKGDVIIRAGTDIKLECEAEGNPPPGYYVWRWENGTVIRNETKGDLEFKDIEPEEGGRLSCAAGSYIGEGEKRHINVFVRVPPRIITSPPRSVSLNETNRLQLFCNATGVPEPTIYWARDGTILRVRGERLSISNVKYSDRGEYTCTADNGIEPNVTATTDVIIYFRPVIVTTSATATLIGAESGQTVDLVCIAEAKPVAEFKWLSYPSMQELNDTLPDVIAESIDRSQPNTITMKVRARIGVKYLCYAYNNRGNDTQIYEIRPKGPPEAPVLDDVTTYIYNVPDQLSTVRAYVKWTPGYDGGQIVRYKVYYGADTEEIIISTDIVAECNCFTITDDLDANKNYVFYVQAHNNDGSSDNSNVLRRKTAAFYGSASVERVGNDGKDIKVSFDLIYTKANLTKQVRYREKKDGIFDWETRIPANPDDSYLALEDLDVDKHYVFQVLWFAEGKVQITSAGEVTPWNPNPNAGESSSNTLSKEEIIAVIAGVGGFLLIVILVLFLCLIRRRQKPKRDETVIVMRRQPQSENVVTRRSLIGSVEDDPFESAHYGTQEKRKSARDSYYLPDSEEMNTFAPDNNTAKRNNTKARVNPAENSQAYQPYKFGQKSKYNNEDESASSDEDSYSYKGKKQKPSDDEMSSEPGYARVGDNGKIAQDNVDARPRDQRPDPNDVYARVNKRSNNNNRPTSNGRGAPPPYRPRSTADPPLPPYPDDHLDLDDPSAVPYDDPLPPPMPVLPSSNSHSIPDGIWNDRYSDDPRDSVDTTMERHKSPSRTSLGSGKPYINAQGKLVRPGSSSRYSSSENFDDSDQRLPEPEVPTGRSRHMDLDNDENNLVSYLV